MWNSWKDFRQLVVIELASFWLGFGNSSLGVSLSLSFSTLDCTFRFAVVNALVILRELFKLWALAWAFHQEGFGTSSVWTFRRLFSTRTRFSSSATAERAERLLSFLRNIDGNLFRRFVAKGWRFLKTHIPGRLTRRAVRGWGLSFTSGNKVAAVSSAEASLVRGTNSCNRSCFAWGRVFCILSLTTTTTTATIVRVRVFRSCC